MTNAQEVSEIDIRERAYDLWERAGRPENESSHFYYLAREQLALESTPDPSIQEMVHAAGYDYTGIKSLRLGEAHFSSFLLPQILNEFPELTQSNPHQSVLWHYTSGSSLVQIIESGEFWTTHLSCLNDGREFIHAFEIMRQVLDLKSREGYTEHHKSLHKFLDSKFEETPSPYSNIYVASLSEKEDDLSQWRAYGGKQGENGYCIGFNTTFVKTRIVGYHTNPFLGKVFYDENRHRQICRRILDIVFRFFEAGGEWNPDLRAKLLYRWLERYAFLWFPLMKNKFYQDEAEWRIVYRASHSDDLNLKFRARENMISRHIPQTYLRPDNKDILLPIQRVIVGPSRYQDISRESVRLQLASKGYNQEKGWTPLVETSKIPLQG